MSRPTRSILNSIMIGTGLRLLRYPFLAASLVILPRCMTAPVYGRFAVFLSVFMLCESFTGMGNAQVFARFVPGIALDRQRERDRLFFGMLAYGVLFTAVIIAIALGLLALRPPDNFAPHWSWALVLTLLLGKIQGTEFAYLYGMNQIARFSSRELIRSATMFIVVLAMFLALGLNGAVWAMAVNEAILVLVAAWWLRKRFRALPGIPPWSECRRYVLFGLGFFVPTFILGLLQRSGGVLIDLLHGDPSQVAYFDLANQFLLLTASFLGVLVATLLPTLTDMHEKQEHGRLQRWLLHSAVFCAACATGGLLTLGTLGPHVIPLLGKTFDFDAVLLNSLILGSALFPLIVVALGQNWAVLRHDAKRYAVYAGLGCCVMFTLSTQLIPRHGALGATLASVAAYALLGVLFAIRYWRTFAPLLWAILRVVLCGLPAAIPCFWRPGLLAAVALWLLSLAVFAAMLVLTRTATVGEVSDLVGALRGRQAAGDEE